MVKLREGRWSLLVPTSVGVRLTPENRQPVHTSTSFDLHATSAETNVGSIVSGLGLPVKVLTSFVAGSPISALIKADLRARGMDVEGPDREQGGRGDTGTSSTLPTAVTPAAGPEFGTTEPGKSA